ncbi:MAG TPA: hypothetical protein VER17_18705 [Tepidisphaeraceae bacterium]|nr:hypothetical protein [Tepidisphaeraceae bacterium]
MESGKNKRKSDRAKQASHQRAVVVAAAAMVAISGAARAEVSPPGGVSGPVVYNVSTTGATAIGRFNSMEGNSFAITLGQNAPLTIGRTTYSLNAGGAAQRLGALDASASSTDPLLAQDRMAYYYHQTGSIEGVLELADTYGLNAAAAVRKPTDATSSNPVWMMGNRVNGVNYNNATNAVEIVSSGTTVRNEFNGYTLGRNYRNTGATDNAFRNSASTATADQVTTAPPGQNFARIAWSDVKAQQAFAKGAPATSAFNARPNTVGYGQGPGAAVGSTTNFQRFRNETSLITATNTFGQDNFRSETIAVVPFTISANPGTGLEILSKTDLQWANVTGRLQNGANFNHSTRDVGSGTRNQYANNLGIDPTWAAGERDRRHLGDVDGAGPISGVGSYSALTTDGSSVTVNVGDEAAPTRAISGSSSSTELAFEHRAGARLRFADKTGGGNVKAAVQSSRMGFGVLSTDNAGVEGKTGNGSLAGQIRVLRLDFQNGHGALLPKPDEITSGKYQLWSQAQAVTVKANPAAADTSAPGGRAIAGDTVDHAGSVGIHRKFIDNITNSVGDFPVGASAVTPADGIINSGFLLPQLMEVTKNFDGDAYGSRTRTAAQQDVYNSYKSAALAPGGFLDWADPSAVAGYNGNTVKYEIYSYNNTATSSSANANKSIVINQRLALAGDFNNDKVRDLQDVADLARARVNPTGYVNGATGWAANSVISGKAGNAVLAPEEGLLVLSDFDGDGNFLSLDAATTATEPVSRKDVRWFLYGAAVDTTDTAGNATLAAAYGTGEAASMTLDRKRRAYGVRLGNLKKNAAVDAYNATIQSLVGSPVAGGSYAGVFTQAQADAEKVNKFDVDADGFADVYDAVTVDRNHNKNFTVLADVMGAADDLVAAELNDDKVINASDVATINAGLTGTGKTNWRGGVLTKTGPGAVTIARAAGAGSEVTVPAGGQTLRISSGSFSAGGTADPFTDSAVASRRVSIENNSAGTGGADLGFNVTAGSKAISALSGTGKTSVAAGASLTADHVRQGQLDVNGTVNVRTGGNNTSAVDALNIGDGGKLDLRDNELVVRTGGAGAWGGTEYTGVAKQIARGRAGGAWTGNGLVTTMPDAADPKLRTSLGVATASEVLGIAPGATATWAGQSVTGTSALVLYTYAGDADLNGKIDGDDYFQIDAHAGQVGGDVSWFNGDFDYNGKVNGDDYFLIDHNIGQQNGSFAPAAAGIALADGVTAVPEPGSAALILLAWGASLPLASRRRRR